MDYNDIRELNDKIYELENQLDKYKSVNLEDIEKLVFFANQMQNLLLKCRNEQINYRLAKEIDDILSQLED